MLLLLIHGRQPMFRFHAAAMHHIPSLISINRKPTSPKLPPGSSLPRQAQRQKRALLPAQPPRQARHPPSFIGPIGSTCAPSVYTRIPSRHHCQILPCMSYKPQAFGTPPRTGFVSSPASPLISIPSTLYGPVVPARQAYSHSASVGKRKVLL